ncbi:hypothetical protein [Desulforapulum autotrophicum]|uniref:hypothetical protein n=1 Tax=Desulforapulum autotrophicum TaxID=2296 RepID=UPI00059E6756|nr:hypothetical protein [Desulforapulum autotrophicum]
MKKIIGMTLMTLLMISIYAAPGYAGSRNQNLVQGIVIGTGAVILGAALLQGFHHDNRVRVVASNHRGYRPDTRQHSPVRGQRAWANPRYERQWNSGHDNRQGHRINGPYERVVVGQKFRDSRRNPGRR